MTVTVVPALQTTQLAQRLKTDHPGGHLVASGHSNTVPLVATELGVQESIVLGEDDYGDLFVITLDAQGGVTLDRQRFGD